MQGLIILSSSPFEVGEEVLFTPPSGPVSQIAPVWRQDAGQMPRVACLLPYLDCLAAVPSSVATALRAVMLEDSSSCGGLAACSLILLTVRHFNLDLLQPVEGIVLDVGWYRTTIRSFEREIFAIPNSVFSRNVVLNVTRKGREWRIFEFIGACCAR
jgi:small-conductance mechanosensitive channel